MQPIDPQIHRHDTLPPVPPAEQALRHPMMPFVILALLGFLGVWGVVQANGANNRLAAETYRYRETFRPAETSSFQANGFEPDESGPTQTPVGEPLVPSAAEQELSRTLAELKSKLSRMDRLAQKVGQRDSFESLEARHEALKDAVANRSVPWKEAERIDLDRRARTLNAEVTRQCDQLEEVATVSL